MEKISAMYQSLLPALQEATEQLDRQKKLAEDLGNALHSSFADVGRTITEAFVKGEAGAIKWKNVVLAVLQDIASKLIQISLIQPIAEGLGAILGIGISAVTAGIGGAGTISGGSGVNVLQGKGGAWRNGMQMFRKGGIVGGPTIFP